MAITVVIAVAALGSVLVFLAPTTQPEQAPPSSQSGPSKSGATALYEQGELEKALPELERLLEEDPRDIDVRTMLASLYWLKGESDKAEAQYREILEIDPDHADSKYRLGILFRQQDRLDEALVQLQSAVELRPDSPLFLSELAKAQTKEGRYEEAVANWRAALKGYPPDSLAQATLYAEIGDVYVRMEKPQLAREAYQAGLKIDPDNEHLKTQLAEL